MNPWRGLSSTSPVRYGSRLKASRWTLNSLSSPLTLILWPFFNFSMMSDCRRPPRRWQPVVLLDDLVGDHARGDLARPANHLRNAECAFPVGVLLTAEGGCCAVGPGVGVWAVVGAVDDDGVLRDAQSVQRIKELTDVSVVVDHDVVVGRLPHPGLAHAFRLGECAGACGSCSSTQRTACPPRPAV